MVVKRKGAARPVVLPCTLLPYDQAFEMGATLGEAARANSGMFDHGAVKLCHPHCAKFCVLGGGSCSAEAPLSVAPKPAGGHASLCPPYGTYSCLKCFDSFRPCA